MQFERCFGGVLNNENGSLAFGDSNNASGGSVDDSVRAMANELCRSSMTKRFSIKTLLLIMTLVGFSCSVYVAICRNLVSTASVVRIEDGMEKSELVELLGQPHKIYPNGNWEYNVWGFSGFVLVSFDENDCVTFWSI